LGPHDIGKSIKNNVPKELGSAKRGWNPSSPRKPPPPPRSDGLFPGKEK